MNWHGLNIFYFFFFFFFTQIISLENKLKKEGFLKKSHEVKEFWDFITVPTNLQDALEDGAYDGPFYIAMQVSSDTYMCGFCKFGSYLQYIYK